MCIGRAIAKGLAAEGVRLCLAARRRELLEQVAKDIVTAGGIEPHIEIVDVMEDGAPERLVKAAEKALGQTDILIDCAGGSGYSPS